MRNLVLVDFYNGSTIWGIGHDLRSVRQDALSEGYESYVKDCIKKGVNKKQGWIAKDNIREGEYYSLSLCEASDKLYKDLEDCKYTTIDSEDIYCIISNDDGVLDFYCLESEIEEACKNISSLTLSQWKKKFIKETYDKGECKDMESELRKLYNEYKERTQGDK